MVTKNLKYYRSSPIAVYGGGNNPNLHIFVIKSKVDYDHNIDVIRNEWGVMDFHNAFLNYYEFVAFVTTVTLKSGAEHFLIFLKEKELDNIKTICHECIHLMTRIFKSRGIEYDIDNDEVMTYFYEWVLDTVLSKLDEIKKEMRNDKPIRHKK